MTKEFSAIILAAGKSERLGFPKLSLKFENNTFIEHIVNCYDDFGCKNVVVVVNEAGYDFIKDNSVTFQENIKIVINQHPEWHRFYSLKLAAMNIGNAVSSFVHNVDNPFVNLEVLKDLAQNSDKADYISPEYQGRGGHPFLVSKRIIQDLQSTELQQMHLKEFLNQYSRLRITVNDEKILTNINTIDEYNKYFFNK